MCSSQERRTKEKKNKKLVRPMGDAKSHNRRLMREDIKHFFHYSAEYQSVQRIDYRCDKEKKNS
jgi:hypothetical protein